jgi:cytochrome P450
MHTTRARDVRALFAEDGQRAWVELTLRYGKTFRHAGMVVTCEPEAVRTLLMDRAHAEVRPAIHRLMAKLPGANGILFMDGEPWLTRTRALMPVFHQRNVDSYARSLRDTTIAHATRWQAQPRVPDLYDAVQQLGAASVLRMGYGLDPDDPLAATLGRALVDYKQLTMRPEARYRLDDFNFGPSKLLALPWILAGIVQTRRLTGTVHRTLRAILADRHARGDRPDWITQLSDAGVSERALAVEINHLYGAFNAIDYVVAAALIELARDRTLAARLRAEMTDVLDDREPPAREDLARLPWTQAFMLEILRRYPVSMGIARQLGKPMELGGETLPTGTQVVILLHALHHHPDFWDDPDQLKPQRWLSSPTPKVPFSYVPFLDGSRKCIGRGMAEMQLLVVLGTILRRFDVNVFGEAIVPPFTIPRFSRPIPFALQSVATAAAVTG